MTHRSLPPQVHETIIENDLFQAGDVVAIGASGGKDSTVLAYVMKTLNERHNYGLNLVLLSVDEGISGYRDDSLETVKRNQQQYSLPLTIVSYKVSLLLSLDCSRFLNPLVGTLWLDHGRDCGCGRAQEQLHILRRVSATGSGSRSDDAEGQDRSLDCIDSCMHALLLGLPCRHWRFESQPLR